MKQLSKEVKDILVKDRKNGLTYKQLAQKYEISWSGARKIVNMYEQRNTNESFKKLCGRKRKTSQRDDHHITVLVKKKPFSSSRVIKDELNLSVSSRTIRRRLNEVGLKNSFAKKKPLLRPANIKKRLNFAKKYVNMPKTFWDKVIWSDESKFELKNEKRRKRVWCEPSQRLKSKNITHTVKHGGGSLMVWGCFSSAGVGRLVKVDSKMTGVHYVNILKENLNSSAEEMGLGDFIFQQDNDPKHTSKVANNYFSENNIEKLDWPPQSPDLNPIEHLWTILDDKIPMESRTNIPAFWEKMQSEWRVIPENIIKNLSSSMPNRLREVINNKGGATKY